MLDVRRSAGGRAVGVSPGFDSVPGENRFANGVGRRTRSAPMSKAAPTPAPAKADRPAILVVDDDRPLLEMWREALDATFAVTTAQSTKDAETLIRKKPFKVIISDHLMPGGNGLSFLVRMREEFPRVQRILVTGYMKPEMLLRSVNEAGLLRYFLKPVNVAELTKTIHEAVKLYDEFKG